MSETSSAEQHETAPVDWIIEIYYFGSAVWPSDVTYRTSGERIQSKVEREISLARTAVAGQFQADPGKITEFLSHYEDCSFLVTDSYEMEGGDRAQPHIRLAGWQELSTAADKAEYEADKRDGRLVTTQNEATYVEPTLKRPYL